MKLKVLLIEPYYTGSHKKWVDDLVQMSCHEVSVITMSGRFWKWRMEGSAIYIADQMNSMTELPDLVMCSSMIDLGFLKGMLDHSWLSIPYIYYMHENQLTYPRSPSDRDFGSDEMHYGFINLKSCLTADSVLFNSEFHRSNFITAAVELMDRLPDYHHKNLGSILYSKSDVIPVGIDFQAINYVQVDDERIDKTAVLLWNHRWEYDKRPDIFFRLCMDLLDDKIDFKLIFLGKNHDKIPDYIRIFHDKNRSVFKYFGYASTYHEYIHLVKSADILPVSSAHDYFGISVIEALYCGLTPILPSDMVYHEHLPSTGYEKYFYEDYSQFLELTKNVISTSDEYKYEPVNQHLTNSYGLLSVISKYDEYFKKKVHENHTP